MQEFWDYLIESVQNMSDEEFAEFARQADMLKFDEEFVNMVATIHNDRSSSNDPKRND